MKKFDNLPHHTTMQCYAMAVYCSTLNCTVDNFSSIVASVNQTSLIINLDEKNYFLSNITSATAWDGSKITTHHTTPSKRTEKRLQKISTDLTVVIQSVEEVFEATTVQYCAATAPNIIDYYHDH